MDGRGTAGRGRGAARRKAVPRKTAAAKRVTSAGLFEGDAAFDADRLGGLAARLSEIGFHESGVRDRLRVPHVSAISLERYPVHRALLARKEDALSSAISLLLLQGAVSREAADEALGAAAVEALLAAGALAPSGRGAVAARVSFFPCAGAVLATDHRHRPTAAARAGAPREPVMYLGGDSYALAYLIPAPATLAGARALDLCTGSGVQAIVAARAGLQVVAIDRNPRAIAFARWNAALNGVAERCDFREGDLYEPLRDDERFDLLLANPPFVPSPHAGRSRIAFRDGGASGEEVLARLLAGVPARLSRDGIAAIVSVFADESGRTFREKLAAWLGRGAELDALLLRIGTDAPEEYAASQTRRAFGDDLDEYEERYARWLGALRRSHLERLHGGVLAMKRRPGPAAPGSFRALDLPPRERPDARLLERALSAYSCARGIIFAEDLLERRARPAEDLVLADELDAAAVSRAPREDPPTPQFRARLRSGAGGEVVISPALRAVLGQVDGKRTIRAIVADVAQSAGADEVDLARDLFPDLLELAERGLLLID